MDKPRLLDQVRDSIRTEQSYLGWIKRFILYNNKKHPTDMGKLEIEAFLTHLAVKRKVSAGTQNQALNAILFLYRQVLNIDLPWLEDVARAKKPTRLPVVLTVSEVSSVLSSLDGVRGLVAQLLDGTGMRLMECIRLRIKLNIVHPCIKQRRPRCQKPARWLTCRLSDHAFALAGIWLWCLLR